MIPSIRVLLPAVQLLLLLCFAAPGLAADAGSDELSQLLDQCKELYRQGNYKSGAEVAGRALALTERPGSDELDTAKALMQVALFQRALDAYDRALPLLERALAIREAKLGPEHPDTAATLVQMAVVYRQLGNFPQGIAL